MNYELLGELAQHKGRLEEAEDWYRKSLTIDETLGNRDKIAVVCYHLGIIAEDTGRFNEAFELMVRCITLFPESPSFTTGPALQRLHRLTAMHGIPALEHAWMTVTDTELPASIRLFAEAKDGQPPVQKPHRWRWPLGKKGK